MHVNDNIILGAGGDYADYQYLKDVIEQKMYVSKYDMYTNILKNPNNLLLISWN
jgi:20S proteasome alpha/beta subunit